MSHSKGNNKYSNVIANATKLKIIKYYGTGSAMSRLLCVWIITASVYFVRMTLYGLNILASSLFVTIHSVKELPTSYSLYCGWGLVPVFMLHIFFGQMIRIGNKLKFVDPMFGIRFRAPWGSRHMKPPCKPHFAWAARTPLPSIGVVYATLTIPISKPPSSNLLLLQLLTFVNTDAIYDSFAPQEWLISFF